MVPAFCDQVVAKQSVESFIGKRNLKIFMGYCPRKVYWNILHCRLGRISTNTLTHVSRVLSDSKMRVNTSASWILYISTSAPQTLKIWVTRSNLWGLSFFGETLVMFIFKWRRKIIWQNCPNISTDCGHYIRASRLQWGKNESQNFNGCRILSQAIGQEKLRTVFVFALAHLEGPPPSLRCLQ